MVLVPCARGCLLLAGCVTIGRTDGARNEQLDGARPSATVNPRNDMRTEAQILADMEAREDGITRCEDGETALFEELVERGVSYNYFGRLFGLVGRGKKMSPDVAALRGEV